MMYLRILYGLELISNNEIVELLKLHNYCIALEASMHVTFRYIKSMVIH